MNATSSEYYQREEGPHTACSLLWDLEVACRYHDECTHHTSPRMDARVGGTAVIMVLEVDCLPTDQDGQQRALVPLFAA